MVATALELITGLVCGYLGVSLLLIMIYYLFFTNTFRR
jgi:hypothetical protein